MNIKEQVTTGVTQPALGGLDQIGGVVRNLDAIKTGMLRVYGLPPRRSVNKYQDNHFRGTEISTHADGPSHDLLGLDELEFLSPRGGPNTWQEFHDARGEGVPCLRFLLPDHRAVRHSEAERGVNADQEDDSVIGRGVKYAC